VVLNLWQAERQYPNLIVSTAGIDFGHGRI